MADKYPSTLQIADKTELDKMPTEVNKAIYDLLAKINEVNGSIPVVDTSAATNVIPYQLYTNSATYSNSTVDATNDIDIVSSYCVGSTKKSTCINATTMTKQLDAVFARGTDKGGLDVGTKAVSKWYYLYSIWSEDGSIKDYILSLSSTTPDLTGAVGFTYYCLIGATYNQSTNIIRPFFRLGNSIFWTTQIQDIALGAIGSVSRLPKETSVPPNTIGIYSTRFVGGASSTYIWIGSTYTADIAPVITYFTHYVAASYSGGGEMRILTNASSQIAIRSSAADASYSVMTIGFEFTI